MGLEFRTDELVDFTEVYVMDEDLAKSIREKADKGEELSELAQKYTERAKYRETNGLWSQQEIKRNKILRLVERDNIKEGAVIGPFKNELGYSVIRIEKVQEPKLKSFEEAIPDFASQYQDYRQKQLSKQWIEKLESSYTVEIYRDKLKKLLSN
jgi:parvulin-like peptidyl-prolyl isomerase